MKLSSILIGAAALMLAVLFWSERAEACGGLFCTASAPVNQAAERIIFSKNADDTVTAVVQIQYDGPSEEFAWVLPVPGIPDVKVSSDIAFTRLQTASNPQYVLNTTFEGACVFAASDGGFGGSGGGGGGGGSSGVVVLASGNVGPYDYVVIQPDASFEEVGQIAVEWLTDEGYDVVPPGGDPSEVAALLGTYLADAMNLIAFRLTKGNDQGTIRPIRITYESEQPMIPIRPTAVAANDDMGVMVWVLGDHRAVPINYRSLELNEALIDWTTSASNYNAVVIEAANQAGGQGFVTERAGPSSDYDEVVVRQFERNAWARLEGSVDTAAPAELVFDSLTFAEWDGYDEVLEDFLSPEEIEALTSCPECVQGLESLDSAAFVEALRTNVIEPMTDTDDLLASRPYATRFYTTLSAPEMDLDPLFDFNPDLADLSNIHNATQVIECDDAGPEGTPSRVELENGQVIRLEPGQPWPFDPSAADALPANAVIKQYSTSGDGVVIADNRAEIDAVLSGADGMGASGGSGGGCSVGGTAPASTMVLLALLVLARRTRTRRRPL